MHPTPLPTALAHLLAASARVSVLVPAAFGVAPTGPLQTSSTHGGGQKRAVRLRYELDNVRAWLGRLQFVLGAATLGADAHNGGSQGVGTHIGDGILPGLSAERKGLVLVREVAAVLGAGAVVFGCLEGALGQLVRLYSIEEEKDDEGGVKVVRWLRHETRGEVWEMMRGLKDLGRAVWFLLTVLDDRASENDVATSREDLRTAVVEILCKENDLARSIKELYPEPGPGLGRLEGGEADTTETASPGSSTAIRIYSLSLSANRDHASVYEVDSDDSDSDSDAGPPTPSSSEFPFPDTAVEGHSASIADISCLDDILIPLAELPQPVQPPQRDSDTLKVITVSTSGVGISPLPQDLDPLRSQPTPETALSADAIFRLPEVTDSAVLDFYHLALRVSRFAPLFPAGKLPREGSEHRASQRKKMAELEPRQFRELCTDLYDELVRRNVEDQNRNWPKGVRQVELVEPAGFSVKRVCARRRLSGLNDGQLASVVGAVMDELARKGQPLTVQGSAMIQPSPLL